MRPPSLHSNFFSSLKQLEKRLRLEIPPDSEPSSSSSTASQVPETNPTPTESLATPLYLQLDQQTNTINTSNSTLQDSSECPQAFLSSSPQFLPTHLPAPETNPRDPPASTNDIDDIEYLMQLLSLSDNLGETENREKQKAAVGGGNSCGCECGFYENIVGVKGPKCDKEVERMEGWIRYFLKSGTEPLRLAFLLLGKSAFERGDGSEFECLEFPSVIDEFLKIDPPKYRD